jgi:pyruvate kinase
MKRFAKIVATLGPSSQSETTLRKLVAAGMDVARLNFSHGTHENHAANILLVRKISGEMEKPVAILQDLQGPKIRVGNLPGHAISLSPGQKVHLSIRGEEKAGPPEAEPVDSTLIPVDFPELTQIVKKGDRILLDDGQLELEVERVLDGDIEAAVILGGILKSHKGLNLPGVPIPISGFTEKDRLDLAFGLAQGIDAVAISFVRTAQDIEAVRSAIQELAPDRKDTLVIAKLERPEALDNLDAILAIVDGVMVARGDLGVEMPPATVPIAQKRIIVEANRRMKFVITATQMLESMIHKPRPTRAEASDVANAVFDGTDALMLSGETAAGQFPVESVLMMDAIIRQAETHYPEWGNCDMEQDTVTQDDAITLTRAARELAHDRNVAAIAVFTHTGRTALLMSKIRPRVPILAFTPERSIFQRLGIYWGVTPYLVPFVSTFEDMLKTVDTAILRETHVEEGQQVVLISGYPIGAMRPPNFAMLHTIGSSQ